MKDRLKWLHRWVAFIKQCIINFILMRFIFLLLKIIFNLIGRPAAWFDKNVVDGLVNATGNTTQAISEKIKGMQSGKVQQYAAYFFAGVLGLILLFVYIWK